MSKEKEAHKRRCEIIRLIQNQLQEYGLNDTMLTLQRESSISMETEQVSCFKKLVTEGEYEQAACMLNVLMPAGPEAERAKFLLIREQFFELVSEKETKMAALALLQQFLTPLCQPEEIPIYSSLLMAKNKDEVQKKTGWSGDREAAKKDLIAKLCLLMPSSIVVPPNRLSSLIDQAISFQKSFCKYHVNEGDNVVSLFVDHHCSDRIAEQLLDFYPHQELRRHQGEAWCVAFSPCSQFLASASSDRKIFIYKLINNEHHQYELTVTIDDLNAAPSALSFSPDSNYLLVCVSEQTGGGGLWDLQTSAWKWRESSGLNAAVWINCRFFIAVHSDDSGIWLKNAEANKTEYRWVLENASVSDLTVDPINQVFYSCSSMSIVAVSLLTRNQITKIEIPSASSDHISCLKFSCVTKRLLAGVNDSTIFLVNPSNRSVEDTFSGHVNVKHQIRCSFAGLNDQLIASGSEDGRIYFWNARHGSIVKIINDLYLGKTVNEVAWHPSEPHVFASASDDGRVIVWKSCLN